MLIFINRLEKAARLTREMAAAALFALLAAAAHADPGNELARARHDLAISEQVLARVSGRVAAARTDPATSPQEQKRLDEYLTRVRDLVELNSERVRALEKTVAAVPAGSSVATGADVPAAATSAEEVAALDARLSGSLADFDALLLEEARKARARAPTRTSAAGLSGTPGSSAEGSNAQNSGRESSKAADTKTARSRTTGPAAPGTPESAPGGRIEGADRGVSGPTAVAPPDVGDGNDDDIVARQIRRAAELETDPELRKKLWDEYRKYKEGTKG